jgi:hypothetical protein
MRSPRMAFPLACFICSDPIESHKSVAYLHTGVVVHVPCRMTSRGADGNTVAIVQPSSAAMQHRVRAVRAAASATRAILHSLTPTTGEDVAHSNVRERGRSS